MFGNLFFGGNGGLLKSSLTKLTSRTPFSKHLPYGTYSPEEQLYINTDETIGFMWECKPLVYASDQTFKILEGLFSAGMPEGSVLIAEFQLEGYKFVALNGGPHFRFTPAVSFFVSCETEAEIVLLLDIPGVDADNLDVDLRDGSLTVTARREESEHQGTPILSEYQGCSYFRSFRVPQSVDEGRITASLTEGVLRLVLPKANRVKRRRIQLKPE